jgi:hypothetical protein
MGDDFEVEWLKERFAELERVLHGHTNILHEIVKEIAKMAINQQQFDADLTTLSTDVATLVDLVNQLVTKLQGGTVDLTNEDTAVKSDDSSVTTAIAAAKAALGQ